MDPTTKPRSSAAVITAVTSAVLSPSAAITAVLSDKHRHLRRLVPLLLRLLLVILTPLLSLLSLIVTPPPRYSLHTAGASTSSSAAARGLEQILSTLPHIPVASRKYQSLLSLADRILDDNVSYSYELESLNRATLSNAFSRTLCRLEEEVALVYWRGEGVVGAVRAGLRKWGGVEVGPEKLVMELLWMAGKMRECGAAGEAVARWGEAAELGRLALGAEPRLQAAFVKLSVFLFKHVIEENNEGEEDQEYSITHRRMAMLTSWLPLLCRASNGAEAPILSNKEKIDIERGFQELIPKLSREHQEEVLSLWLHHFTTSPDSDWPNLRSCYTQWYAESRKLLHE